MINYDCRFLCQYQQMEAQIRDNKRLAQGGIQLFKLVEINQTWWSPLDVQEQGSHIQRSTCIH